MTPTAWRLRWLAPRCVSLGVAVAALLLTSAPASAYVRTMTCREVTGPSVDPLACREGEEPIPIYWAPSCVVVHTNQNGCADIDDDEALFEAIRRSYATWNAVSCSYVELIDGGLTNEDRVGYNSCDPSLNANVIMFRNQGWSHQRDALALTSVTYDMKSGQIVDADIEFNDERFTFSVTDNPFLIEIDVENTVTHELGHFLGLDHSPEIESTMFATAPTGETKKRDLDQDDIDGLCEIYPTTIATPACSTASVGFFNRPEQGPGAVCEVDDGCCSTARPAGGGPSWVAALLAALWLVRRRNTDRHPST